MSSSYLSSIAASGLFKYIKPSDYQTAWEDLSMMPKAFHAEQIIFGQEEKVTRVAIVHEGLVKGERLRIEGTSSLAYYYYPGEVFAFEVALSGRKTSPLQITAESDCTVIFFDINKVFYSTFEKQLLQGLMELLANDDIKKLYRIETLSHKSLRDRIMSHFTVMASRGDGRSFQLNMTQNQLAKYLCVNRSALSHELNQMKREGIIDFDKKKFTLLQK